MPPIRSSSITEDPVEQAILERAFEAWQQLGRTLRAQQGRVEQRMREAERLERRKAWDDALELGSRLFCDSNGPNQFYPNRPPIAGTTLTSGIDGPGDPDQPARLVLRLDSRHREHRRVRSRARSDMAGLDARVLTENAEQRAHSQS